MIRTYTQQSGLRQRSPRSSVVVLVLGLWAVASASGACNLSFPYQELLLPEVPDNCTNATIGNASKTFSRSVSPSDVLTSEQGNFDLLSHPAPHIRFGAVVTAVVAGVVGSAVALDGTTALHAARLLTLDIAIRMHKKRCSEGEQSSTGVSRSLSLTQLIMPEHIASTTVSDPGWWLISPSRSEKSANRVLGVLGLTATVCGLALGASAVLQAASRTALEPSANKTPRCPGFRRVVREGNRWRLIPAAAAAMQTLVLGPTLTWTIASCFHVSTGPADIAVVVVAFATGVLACFPAFCACARWPSALARARFVRHLDDDPVASRAGWLRRRLFLPRGQWQFASTWDADAAAAALSVFPVVPRRLFAPLVETLVAAMTSVAVGLAADCRPARSLMVWGAVINGTWSFVVVLALPFVLPWVHGMHFFVSVLLSATCRFIGVAPRGETHDLSTADRILTATASIVTVEAITISAQFVWASMYRRPDRYAVRQVAFDKPHTEPLLILPVHRRAAGPGGRDTPSGSETDTDAGNVDESDEDLPKADDFPPCTEVIVVQGDMGIHVIDWPTRGPTTGTVEDPAYAESLPAPDAAWSTTQRAIEHSRSLQRTRPKTNPLLL